MPSTRPTYLLLFREIRAHRLDSIPALDDVCLERDGAWAAMELQEQTAGVAEHGAHLVAAP